MVNYSSMIHAAGTLDYYSADGKIIGTVEVKKKENIYG